MRRIVTLLRKALVVLVMHGAAAAQS